MKQLSFKRYEGDPATSGFVVYRRRTDTFRGLLSHTGFSWKSLDDIHTIDVNFFENPLSYRFVDGIHSVYASDIKMNTHGTVLLEKVLSLDAVDRLSHRATAELLKAAGKKSFGIFVNETSEVEIVLPNDRLVVWRNGFWSIFDPRLFRVFLANSLDEDVLDSLVWTTYALSKTRHGTVILVGDIEKKALSELKAGDVAGRNRVSKGLIGNLKNEKLTGLKEQGLLFGSLSSDGLTVLDHNGKLIDTGVIVDTSRGTEKDDKQKEGGGRTAAAKAASVYGKVIKVSEDGPIEFYEDKQRLCRLG
jgi:hypothetical protein